MKSAARRAIITGGGAIAVAAAGAVIALAIAGRLSLFQACVLIGLVVLAVLVAALTVVARRIQHAVRRAERELTATVRAESADLSSAIARLAERQRAADSRLHRQVDAVGSDLTKSITRLVDAYAQQEDEHHRSLTAGLDRVQREEKQLYWQLEALLDLRAQLPPRAPLPPLRGWAASPDVLHWMLTWAQDHQPRRIVECGSGASTVLFGYHVKRAGVGSVIALEHDAQFAEESRDLAHRHGVDDVVEIREAQLTEWEHGGRLWRWYDLAAVADIASIDLLFIDGPPQATGELARFPAGPVLLERLAPNGVAVLDDARRADESRVSDLWLEQLPGLARERLKTDKGTDVFRRPSR